MIKKQQKNNELLYYAIIQGSVKIWTTI